MPDLSMALSSNQKRFLRQRAHSLKPVVIIGQHGLTENVIQEIDNALAHHELIKVRVNAGDRQARQKMVDQITERTGAKFIMLIGHVAVYYRTADKPRIQLPR